MSLASKARLPRAYTWMCYRCQREVRSPVEARCPDCSFLLVIECDSTPAPGLWQEEAEVARQALRTGAPPLPGVDPQMREAMLRALARRVRSQEPRREPTAVPARARRPFTALLAEVLARVMRHGS